MKAILIDWGDVISWNPEPQLLYEWERVAHIDRPLEHTQQFFEKLLELIKQINDLDNILIKSIQNQYQIKQISEYLAKYHKLCYVATLDTKEAIKQKGNTQPFSLKDITKGFSYNMIADDRKLKNKFRRDSDTGLGYTEEEKKLKSRSRDRGEESPTVRMSR